MAEQELALRTEDSLAETDLKGTFPAILVRAGKAACFAADEFFSARISNPHTRIAYAHQVSRFLAWCEDQGLELHQVTPGLAGRFLDELPHKAPTKNQALAALRYFFDVLVARRAALLNPFQSVRGGAPSLRPGPDARGDRRPGASAPRLHPDGQRVRASGPGGPRDAHLRRRPGRGHQPAPDAGSSRQRQPPVAAVCGKKKASPGRSRCVTTWMNGSRPTSKGPA